MTSFFFGILISQLIRENNKALDKTYIYSYNEIGNITSVKNYTYFYRKNLQKLRKGAISC